MQTLSGVPSGYEVFVLNDLIAKNDQVVFVASNDKQMASVNTLMARIFPKVKVLQIPAWDTVPYDRVAPAAEIIGRQIDTLVQLLNPPQKCLVLTTAAAWGQLLPPQDFFKGSALSVRQGQTIAFDEIQNFLNRNGYEHRDVVMESGEYAIRGGIIDIFPAGMDNPVRLDFFGDEVDSIKLFDATSQRTTQNLDHFEIKPNRLFRLDDASKSQFRTGYRELFGIDNADMFYTAVSEGRYVQGLEHFLPLFYGKMKSFADYCRGFSVVLDHAFERSLDARYAQITEYYEARKQALKDKTFKSVPYHPIPPEKFFLDAKKSKELLQK